MLCCARQLYHQITWGRQGLSLVLAQPWHFGEQNSRLPEAFKPAKSHQAPLFSGITRSADATNSYISVWTFRLLSPPPQPYYFPANDLKMGRRPGRAAAKNAAAALSKFSPWQTLAQQASPFGASPTTGSTVNETTLY